MQIHDLQDYLKMQPAELIESYLVYYLVRNWDESYKEHVETVWKILNERSMNSAYEIPSHILEIWTSFKK